MTCFFKTLMTLAFIANVSFSVAQDSQPATEEFPKAAFGIKGGLNISSFSASINSESRAKAGPAFGFYVRKQLRAKSFFRTELYYSSQGQKDNYVPATGGGPSLGSTTTTLHYLNIPFIFEFGRKLSFHAGCQFGILVAGREKGTVRKELWPARRWMTI
jgi:hypothetical protein